MTREDRAKEKAAAEVVHIVIKHFRAYGLVKDDDVRLGRAIADAAQSIEDRVIPASLE